MKGTKARRSKSRPKIESSKQLSGSSSRERDANRTRTLILDSARRLFRERSYEQIGLREIAESAGVDAALIARYFGSKDGLFAEAIEPSFAIGALLEVERNQFAQQLVRHVIEKSHNESMQSIRLLLMSAANPTAKEELRNRLTQQFIVPLAQWIGGRNAPLRASLIASELLGLIMMREIVGVESLNPKNQRELIRQVAQSIQAHID